MARSKAGRPHVEPLESRLLLSTEEFAGLGAFAPGPTAEHLGAVEQAALLDASLPAPAAEGDGTPLLPPDPVPPADLDPEAGVTRLGFDALVWYKVFDPDRNAWREGSAFYDGDGAHEWEIELSVADGVVAWTAADSYFVGYVRQVQACGAVYDRPSGTWKTYTAPYVGSSTWPWAVDALTTADGVVAWAVHQHHWDTGIVLSQVVGYAVYDADLAAWRDGHALYTGDGTHEWAAENLLNADGVVAWVAEDLDVTGYAREVRPSYAAYDAAAHAWKAASTGYVGNAAWPFALEAISSDAGVVAWAVYQFSRVTGQPVAWQVSCSTYDGAADVWKRTSADYFCDATHQWSVETLLSVDGTAAWSARDDVTAGYTFEIRPCYAAFDRVRGTWQGGCTQYFGSSTYPVALEQLLGADGVVTWSVRRFQRASGVLLYRQVGYALYDPALAAWQDAAANYPCDATHEWRIEELTTADGVVAWSAGDCCTGGDLRQVRACYARYDPAGDVWRPAHTEYLGSDTQPWAIESLANQDGVVAWSAYQYDRGSMQVLGRYVGTAIYDPLAADWRADAAAYAGWVIVSAATIDAATVHYAVNAAEQVRGYDAPGETWFDGETVPVAYAVASQTRGPSPLSVFFADLSIGAAEWHWSFGDGAESAEPSPHHTFTGLDVFAVTQTVTGPAGGDDHEILVTTDVVAPTGSILINGGAAFATSPTVALTLSAVDNSGAVARMRFSEDAADWGDWEPYATGREWTLSAGDGVRPVCVQFADEAGNVSPTYTDAIVLDTTPPAAPVVTGTTPTPDETPTWSWTPGGGGSGVYRYELDDDDLTSGAVTAPVTQFTPAEPLPKGEHTLYVQERDDAGNWSAVAAHTIDILPDAVDDAYDIPEDSDEVELDVLANDRDLPSQPEPPEVLDAGGATHGTVEVLADRSGLLYRPNPGFYGSDSLTYTMRSGAGGTDTASVSITVTPVSPLPGDTNLDGKVDQTDYFAAEGHFGTASGATRAQGDFDDDGDVDFLDYLAIKSHYGRAVTGNAEVLPPDEPLVEAETAPPTPPDAPPASVPAARGREARATALPSGNRIHPRKADNGPAARTAFAARAGFGRANGPSLPAARLPPRPAGPEVAEPVRPSLDPDRLDVLFLAGPLLPALRAPAQ